MSLWDRLYYDCPYRLDRYEYPRYAQGMAIHKERITKARFSSEVTDARYGVGLWQQPKGLQMSKDAFAEAAHQSVALAAGVSTESWRRRQEQEQSCLKAENVKIFELIAKSRPHVPTVEECRASASVMAVDMRMRCKFKRTDLGQQDLQVQHEREEGWDSSTVVPQMPRRSEVYAPPPRTERPQSARPGGRPAPELSATARSTRPHSARGARPQSARRERPQSARGARPPPSGQAVRTPRPPSARRGPVRPQPGRTVSRPAAAAVSAPDNGRPAAAVPANSVGIAGAEELGPNIEVNRTEVPPKADPAELSLSGGQSIQSTLGPLPRPPEQPRCGTSAYRGSRFLIEGDPNMVRNGSKNSSEGDASTVAPDVRSPRLSVWETASSGTDDTSATSSTCSPLHQHLLHRMSHRSS